MFERPDRYWRWPHTMDSQDLKSRRRVPTRRFAHAATAASALCDSGGACQARSPSACRLRPSAAIGPAKPWLRVIHKRPRRCSRTRCGDRPAASPSAASCVAAAPSATKPRADGLVRRPRPPADQRGEASGKQKKIAVRSDDSSPVSRMGDRLRSAIAHGPGAWPSRNTRSTTLSQPRRACGGPCAPPMPRTYGVKSKEAHSVRPPPSTLQGYEHPGHISPALHRPRRNLDVLLFPSSSAAAALDSAI